MAWLAAVDLVVVLFGNSWQLPLDRLPNRGFEVLERDNSGDEEENKNNYSDDDDDPQRYGAKG